MGGSGGLGMQGMEETLEVKCRNYGRNIRTASWVPCYKTLCNSSTESWESKDSTHATGHTRRHRVAGPVVGLRPRVVCVSG